MGPPMKKRPKSIATALDDIVLQMGADVKDEQVDAMKEAIKKYKEAIASMFPNMDTANPNAVWAAVKDKVSLCLCPQTQKNENVLEGIISAEEVPPVAEVLGKVEEVTQEEGDLVRELFDSLEVAHSHLAIACSTLSRLSNIMRPANLMTILDTSIRPLIQIKTTMAWKPCDTPEETRELPDDPEERVELIMLPTPTARTLRDEKINSPTRLLVATWAYRVSNVFGKGSTQRRIQEAYSVRAKQLSACITGQKYLWGADRKRRLSGNDESASAPKKPSTSSLHRTQ